MPKPKLPPKEFSWTPQLAYIVGLIATDGNLSKDGRHITMRSKDRDLLEIFCKCLKLNNQIGINYPQDIPGRNPCYRIQFSNVQFYRWLLGIGLFPSKTFTLGPIKIPDIYFRDFLRGHLDGDGSIIIYKDAYNFYKGKQYINTRIYTRFISASESHIRWLYKMISKCAPVQGIFECRNFKNGKSTMWGIRFAKYNSLELFRWLYYQKDLPTLLRKQELAEKLLSKVTNGKLININLESK